MTIDASRTRKLRVEEELELHAAVQPAPGKWRTVYPLVLVVLDLASYLVTAVLASNVQFHGDIVPTHRGGTYAAIALLTPVVWVGLLASTGCYKLGRIGIGADEYKGVFYAAVRLTALICFAAYVLQVPISREYVAVALPIGTLLTLVFRYAARKTVHRLRHGGRCSHAVVAVGSAESTNALERQLHRDYTAGLTVVASLELTRDSDIDELFRFLQDYGADTVAVASSIEPELLRRLGWQLEGRGITLLVAPALTNIAGPRISIRPVSGLPLLEVEEPNLTGGRQRVKAVIDRVAAAALLMLLSPLLLGVGVLIRRSSNGRALFTQERLGRGGRPFTIYKFRTMYEGADRRFHELMQAQEDNAGGMFVKAPRDPRVTPIGRFLRRYSIDEIPQLINVLKGDMSLVGPRPLPVEVLQMGADVRRRLLVRPGMTGLGQVSVRWALPSDEAVRIGLSYVENWMLSFDLMILWKTASGALRVHGAY